MATRVFSAAACLEHRPPRGFPEVAERLSAIVEHLVGGPWAAVEAPSHAAAEAAIERTHGGGYLRRLRRAVERGDGLIDSADNPLCPATWTAARAAVDATLAAADHAARGNVAFAAVRPPGHHAERSLAMGFCYLNNVAVAAEHLLATHGCERLAIFDFDVHHGNGTQHIFEERGDVLYASTHQWPLYPGTGAAGERGRGAGVGATLNVPLPAGSGDAEYRQAIVERIAPAIADFGADALLVSAGFDAWREDPLGGMRVGREAFGEWGSLLAELAAESCGGRLVSVLEGGYDLATLPRLVETYLEGLSGSRPG